MTVKDINESINYSVSGLDNNFEYYPGNAQFMSIEDEVSDQLIDEIVEDIKDNIVPQICDILPAYVPEMSYARRIPIVCDSKKKSEYWELVLEGVKYYVNSIEIRIINHKKFKVAVTITYFKKNKKDLIESDLISFDKVPGYVRFIERIENKEGAEIMSDVLNVFYRGNGPSLQFFMNPYVKESINYSVSNLDNDYVYHMGDWRTDLSSQEPTPELIDKIIDDLNENVIPEIRDIFPEFEEITNGIEKSAIDSGRYVWMSVNPDYKDPEFITYISKKYSDYDYYVDRIEIYIEVREILKVNLKICLKHPEDSQTRIFYVTYYKGKPYFNENCKSLSNKELAAKISETLRIFTNSDDIAMEYVNESVDYSILNLDKNEYRSGDWRYLNAEDNSPELLEKINIDLENNIIPQIRDIVPDISNTSDEMVRQYKNSYKWDSGQLLGDEYKCKIGTRDFYPFITIYNAFTTGYIETLLIINLLSRGDYMAEYKYKLSFINGRKYINSNFIHIDNDHLAYVLSEIFNIMIGYDSTTPEMFMEGDVHLNESVNYSVTNQYEPEDEYKSGTWRNLKKIDYPIKEVEKIKDDIYENIISQLQDIFMTFEVDEPLTDFYYDEDDEFYSYYYYNCSKSKEDTFFWAYGKDKSETPYMLLNFVVYISKVQDDTTNEKGVHIEFVVNARKYITKKSTVDVLVKIVFSGDEIKIDECDFKIDNLIICEQLADFMNVVLNTNKYTAQDFYQDPMLVESVNYSVLNIEEPYEANPSYWRVLPAGLYSEEFFKDVLSNFEDTLLPQLKDIFPDSKEIIKDKVNMTAIDREYRLILKDKEYAEGVWSISRTIESFYIKDIAIYFTNVNEHDNFRKKGIHILFVICLEIDKHRSKNIQVHMTDGQTEVINDNVKINNLEICEKISESLNLVLGSDKYSPYDFYASDLKSLSESVNYSVLNLDNNGDYKYSPGDYSSLYTIPYSDELFKNVLEDFNSNIIPLIREIFPEFVPKRGDFMSNTFGSEFVYELINPDTEYFFNKLSRSGRLEKYRIKKVLLKCGPYSSYLGINSETPIFINASVILVPTINFETNLFIYLDRFGEWTIDNTPLKITDYEVCEQIADYFNLIAGKEIVSPDDYYLSEDSVKIDESINYSVSSIEGDQVEYNIDNPYWWLMTHALITKEQFMEDIKPDFINDFVPYVCDIFDGFYLDSLKETNTKAVVNLKTDDMEYWPVTGNYCCSNIKLSLEYNRFKKDINLFISFERKSKNTGTKIPDVNICLYGHNPICSVRNYSLEPKFASAFVKIYNIVCGDIKPKYDYFDFIEKGEIKESVDYSVANDNYNSDEYKSGDWRTISDKNVSTEMLSRIAEDINENIIPEIYDIFSDIDFEQISELEKDDDIDDYSLELETAKDESYDRYFICHTTIGPKRLKINSIMIDLNLTNDHIFTNFYILFSNPNIKQYAVRLQYSSARSGIRDITVPSKSIEDEWICQQLSDFCNLVLGKDQYNPADFYKEPEHSDDITESVDYSVNDFDKEPYEYRSGDWRTIRDKHIVSDKIFTDIAEDINQNIIPEILDIFSDIEFDRESVELKQDNDSGYIFEISTCDDLDYERWFTYYSLENTQRMMLNEISINLYKVGNSIIVSFSISIFKHNNDEKVIDIDFCSKSKRPYFNISEHSIDDIHICEQLADFCNLVLGKEEITPEDFYRDPKNLEDITESVDYSVANLDNGTYEYRSGDWRTIRDKHIVSDKILSDIAEDLNQNIIPEILDIFSDIDYSRRMPALTKIRENQYEFEIIASEDRDYERWFTYKFGFDKHIMLINRIIVFLYKSSGSIHTEFIIRLSKVNFNDEVVNIGYSSQFGTPYIDVKENCIDDYFVCEQLAEFCNLVLGSDEFKPDDFYLASDDPDDITESVNYSVTNLDNETYEYKSGDWRTITKDHATEETLLKIVDDLNQNVIPEILDIFSNGECTGSNELVETRKNYFEFTIDSCEDDYTFFYINTKTRFYKVNVKCFKYITRLGILFYIETPHYRIIEISYSTRSSENPYIEIEKNCISDYSVCEQLSDFCNLVLGKEEYTPDDFYRNLKNLDDITESVNYSVTNLDKIDKVDGGTYEYKLGDWRTITKDNVSEEILLKAVDDLNQNIIPEILDIFPNGECVGMSELSDTNVKYENYYKFSMDFSDDDYTFSYHSVETKFYKIIVKCFITYENRLSVKFEVDTLHNSVIEIDYSCIFPNNLYINIKKNCIDDYFVCEQLADFCYLVLGKYEYTPDDFYEMPKNMTESVNYSINNIDGIEYEYRNGDWRSLKEEYISQDTFLKVVEDIRENIIPTTIDIFYNVYCEKDDFYQLSKNHYGFELDNRNSLEESSSDITRVEIELNNHRTDINCVFNVDIKHISVLKIRYKLGISSPIITFNSSLTSDYETCEQIADFGNLVMGFDRFKPEMFMSKKAVSESINYSVSGYQGEESADEMIYNSGWWRTLDNTDVSKELFERVKDDFKENIIPEIKEIFYQIDEWSENETQTFIDLYGYSDNTLDFIFKLPNGKIERCKQINLNMSLLEEDNNMLVRCKIQFRTDSDIMVGLLVFGRQIYRSAMNYESISDYYICEQVADLANLWFNTNEFTAKRFYFKPNKKQLSAQK